MSQTLRSILRFAFFLALGIFFVWWSVKDLTQSDTLQIRSALGEANAWLAIPGFFVLLFSHWVRALRWRLLIQPLGYNPSKANTFYAVMTGYLANQAIPRLGEVLKCSTLARYEKIPLDKLIGSVILERLIDTLCFLLIFLLTIAFQPDLYDAMVHTFFESGPGKGKGHLWIYALAVSGLIAVAVLIWMVVSGKNFRYIFKQIKNIIARIWQGLTAIRHLKKRWTFLFYTAMIWLLYAICGYIGFIAFDEMQQYGIKEMMMVLCAGSIGMVATPGGIGAYAFLLQKTMQLYGAGSGVALAYGWVMWLMQILVVLAGGLFSLIALPIRNKTRSFAKP